MKYLFAFAVSTAMYLRQSIPTHVSVYSGTPGSVGGGFVQRTLVKAVGRFRVTKSKQEKVLLRTFVDFLILFRNEMLSGQGVVSAFQWAAMPHNSSHVAGPRDLDDLNTMLAARFAPVLQSECDSLRFAIQASIHTGVSLTSVLDVLIDSVRHRIRSASLITSELASTRASITVLAGLPLLGFLLSTMSGAHSLQWLLGTSLGRGCLVAAILLETLGMLWVRALIARATRSL